MAKPPAISARGLEHQCVDEFFDDVVDLIVTQGAHRTQQAAIDVAADNRRHVHDRHDVRTGPKPGEQRLIQRLRTTGPPSATATPPTTCSI